MPLWYRNPQRSPPPGSGATDATARRSSRSYVPDLLHVAPGGGRGLVLGAAALARDHVGGVPVPPVVRRGDRLERAVAVGRLVQQGGEGLDVHGSAPRQAGLGFPGAPIRARGGAGRKPRGVRRAPPGGGAPPPGGG